MYSLKHMHTAQWPYEFTILFILYTISLLVYDPDPGDKKKLVPKLTTELAEQKLGLGKIPY